jgi:hypothetical protein
MNKSSLAAIFAALCIQIGCGDSSVSRPQPVARQQQKYLEKAEELKATLMVTEKTSNEPLHKLSLSFLKRNDAGTPVLNTFEVIRLQARKPYQAEIRFNPPHALVKDIVAADLYWDCESGTPGTTPTIFEQLGRIQAARVNTSETEQSISLQVGGVIGFSCKNNRGQLRIHFDRNNDPDKSGAFYMLIPAEIY